MKRVVLIVLCMLAFPVVASHIVGGEFELIHLSGNTYRLNLIVYFDKINGSAGAKDTGVNSPRATIYRKRDGQEMKEVLLLLTEEGAVKYSQPECSDDGLKTDRLFYTAIVTLPAEDFDDPQGYYVSWQRCCRNYSISNILSNVPSQDVIKDPNAAGQTFYLEFPAVVRNGQPFINSSPRLFPPLSDYGCPNRLYYVDFAGVDDDNDSLVYSLTTPLNTSTTQARPNPSPAPYPEVTWQPGFSLDHIMRGSPELNISRSGLLTVKPTLQGLFVFAVKVEEFRNGEKIGESRRDFQMLVTDGCPRAEAPQILGKKLNDTDYSTSKNLSVSFAATVPDNERCMTVRVTDKDSERAEDFFSETVRIRIVPLNFKSTEIAQLLPAKTLAILTHGSAAEFKICFPKCPFFEGGPYQIGIIAADDACSQPLLDTLKVSVYVEPPPNERVKFITPDKVTTQVTEGDVLSLPFEARDAEKDNLLFFALPNGFDMNLAGMKTTIQSNADGIIKGTLSWDAFCDIYNFTNRTSFELKLLVDDDDLCKFNEPDTATYNLSVKLPGNADPIVDTDLTSDPQEVIVNGLQKVVNTEWKFNVSAKDVIDNDFLSLRMIATDFKPSDYGITFSKVTGNGNLQSQFSWNLLCDKVNVKTKDEFQFKFVATDSTNKCRILKADTVTVNLKVLPDENTKPTLSFASLNDRVPFVNNSLVAYLNDPINLELMATDPDLSPAPDQLVIDLIDKDGDYPPTGYTFTPVMGQSGVKTTFKWAPDCALFRNDIYENHYTFTFRAADLHCGTTKADTIEVDVTWKDYESGVLLGDPPNIFTPNGDGQNDYFAMEKRDAEGNLINLIPPDNCTGTFSLVKIFNRWGEVVFESTDRNFKWLAKNEPVGVYYYYLKFSNREYKGGVSIQY